MRGPQPARGLQTSASATEPHWCRRPQRLPSRQSTAAFHDTVVAQTQTAWETYPQRQLRLAKLGAEPEEDTRCFFASDNVRGVLPEVMEALAEANRPGTTPSYGADPLTAEACAAVRRWLCVGDDADVTPVVSGIASDGLALAPLVPPTGAVYCHRESHVYEWQANSTGFYTGGAMLFPLPGEGGKLTPAVLEAALSVPGTSYRPDKSAVSITQPTECGTVYTPAEVAAIATVAHAAGCVLHVDGARFANAVLATGADPADLTWRAGVDVLSLGTTKGGTMAAEVVVFFSSPEKTAAAMEDFQRRQKRAGHVLSKLRFVSAQLLAYFEHGGRDGKGLWRQSAGHSNEAAAALAKGLLEAARPELALRLGHPVQTNQVFMVVSNSCPVGQAALAALCAPPVTAVPWHLDGLGPDEVCLRFVTAFNTTPEEIAAAVQAVS